MVEPIRVQSYAEFLLLQNFLRIIFFFFDFLRFCSVEWRFYLQTDIFFRCFVTVFNFGLLPLDHLFRRALHPGIVGVAQRREYVEQAVAGPVECQFAVFHCMRGFCPGKDSHYLWGLAGCPVWAGGRWRRWCAACGDWPRQLAPEGTQDWIRPASPPLRDGGGRGNPHSTGLCGIIARPVPAGNCCEVARKTRPPSLPGGAALR